MPTSIGDLSINISANTASIEQGFAKLNDTISSRARAITSQFDAINDRVEALKVTLGTLAGAALAGFAVRFAKSIVEDAIEAQANLQDLADKVGTTASALSALVPAAKLSGTSLEEVGAASVRFSKTLVEVQSGQGKAAAAFKAIGLSAQDAARFLKDPTQGLFELSKQLATYADDGNKAAVVTELLGKSGANLLPFLKQLAEQSGLAATVTDEQAKAAKRLQDQWGELGLRSADLKNAIAGALVPAFSTLVTAFAEATNKSGGLRDAVKELAADGTLQIWALNVGVALASAAEAIGTFVKAIQTLAASIPVAIAGFKVLGDAAGIVRGDVASAANIKGDFENFKSELSIAGKAWKDFWDYNGNVASTAIANERRLLEQRRDTARKITAEQAKAMADFSKSVEGFALGDTGPSRASVDTTGFAKAAATVDKFKSVLESAQKTLQDTEFALADFGAAADEKTTPALRRLLELELSPDWATYTKLQQKQVETTLLAADANQRLLETSKAAAAADIAGAEHMLKLREQYTKELEQQATALQRTYDAVTSRQAQALADSITGIENEIAAEKLRNDTIGLSRAAYIGLSIAQEESYAASLRLVDGAEQEVRAAELRIARLQQLQQVVASGESLQLIHDSYVDLFRDIADAGANFIEDFVTHGSKAFKNLWANFKSWALSALAKIAAQQVVVSIAGAIGLGGVATNALAGTSSLGNLLGIGSSASNLASGGGLLGGLLGDLPSLGTALSNIGGGISTFTTLLGEGAGILESASAAAAGLGTSFLAVLGPIGAVAAAVALGFSLFGKKGGPKSGGSASTDPNAERFFTPSDSDATVKSIVESVSTTYEKVAKSFGATLTNANFALGFDTDPKGTAPNRISASASVGGQQVFSARDVDIGRDPNQIQGELATAASRALLAALQASDLPQYLANILNSVTAATASTEQINNIIATAQAIQQVVNVLPQLGDVFAGIDPTAIQGVVTAFGGIDAFLSSATAATNVLYTDAERAAKATQALSDTFSQFGLDVPKTAEEYRKLLSSLDPSSEEFAILTRASTAWAAVYGSAQDATDAIEAQAEANRELVRSAEDFYNENFFSAAEKAAKQQAEYTKQLDDFQKKFGVSLPRSIAGFRAYIDGIDRATDAGEKEYQAAIKVSQAVYGLATATESAADTISDAADAINKASASINVGFGAVISAGEKLAGQIETQIDTAIDGLDFGESLSKKVQLIGSSIAGLEQRRVEQQSRGLDTGSLDFAIAALNRDNQKATAALASFVTLTAQYGSAIAEQLEQLQEKHAQDLFDLRQASPDVLAQLNATFAQQWQAIINGTAAGVDGTLTQLEKLRQGIRDYLDDLRQSDLSTLKPGQKLAEAQAKFNADLAKARAGDAEALQNITKDADTLLRDARDVFGSGRPFADIFDTVESSLEGLLATSGTTVSSVAENSTAAIAAALPAGSTLASSADSKAIKDEIAEVREAVAALADVIDGAADRSTAANTRLAKQSPNLK